MTSRQEQSSPRTASRLIEPLHFRPFRALFLAETLSLVGDQLARVALSYLVFVRTDSVVATAATYALTYLPAVLGGIWLAGAGDKRSRRDLMIGVDLVRAGLFAVMAVPGLPLGVVAVAVAVAVLIGPVFASAEVSYLASAMPADAFRAGNGLRMVALQLSQVVGFALAGLFVALIGPHVTLFLNAVTFVVSAAFVAWGLGRTPAPITQDEPTATGPAASAQRFTSLWRDQRTRASMPLVVVVALFVVAEAVAIPLGRDIGAGTTQVGLLLAALPLGSAVGAIAVVRLVSADSSANGLLAVACGIPLVASAVIPHWPAVLLCWFAAGVLSAYQVNVLTRLVRSIPDGVRAAQVGRVSSWLLGAQGVAFLLGGLVAHFVGPAAAIALTAAAGSVSAFCVWLARGESGRHRTA